MPKDAKKKKVKGGMDAELEALLGQLSTLQVRVGGGSAGTTEASRAALARGGVGCRDASVPCVRRGLHPPHLTNVFDVVRLASLLPRSDADAVGAAAVGAAVGAAGGARGSAPGARP